MESPTNTDDLQSFYILVCTECGISANVMTCLFRYGKPPKKLAYSVSTFRQGICDWCKKKKPVTEVRDFFYPDFSFLQLAADIYKAKKKSS